MTGNLCVTIDKMIMVDIMGFMIEDVLILNVCLLIENVKRKWPDALAGFYAIKLFGTMIIVFVSFLLLCFNFIDWMK